MSFFPTYEMDGTFDEIEIPEEISHRNVIRKIPRCYPWCVNEKPDIIRLRTYRSITIAVQPEAHKHLVATVFVDEEYFKEYTEQQMFDIINRKGGAWVLSYGKRNLMFASDPRKGF